MNWFQKLFSSSPVRFKERLRLPGQLMGEDIYEVYAASTEAEAKAFLATKSVTRQQHYIVVETPEGVFAKDQMGEYAPSRNWRG